MKKRVTSTALEDKPPAQKLFQRLERIESEMDTNAYTGHQRWMIPYADLLTLLLGLFLVIFTSTQAKLQPEKMPAQQSLTKTETVLPQKMVNQLKDKLKLKNVEVRQLNQNLVISLQDSILFAPGSAELSPQAKQTLDQLMQELRASMDTELHPIRVEGHTDNTPIHTAQFPSNWELSTARATSILRYLLTSHQFPPTLLSAAGYAEFKPLYDNSTIEGKQKNRRVDIVVLRPRVPKQDPIRGLK